MTEGFRWPVRVYYEDTDSTGVVYHARYLQYFERARTEWLRAHGTSQQNLRERAGVVFTVADVHIQFHSPARLDDELLITVAVEQQKRASLVFSQKMTRGDAPGTILASARVRVACVDATRFRPCAIPDKLLPTMNSNGVRA